MRSGRTVVTRTLRHGEVDDGVFDVDFWRGLGPEAIFAAAWEMVSERPEHSEAKVATNPDFRDLFSALSAEGAEYIVVGAHAVMFHSVPRYTKDLDLWVRPSHENAGRVRRALIAFGAPVADLTVTDLSLKGTVFQIGVAPNRIDVLTSIDGVEFDDAYPRSVPTTYGDAPIRMLSVDDLLTNKRAVGRKQDEIDVENLERARRR